MCGMNAGDGWDGYKSEMRVSEYGMDVGECSEMSIR